MICAIVLAAGRSRRMGVPKLLLPFGGRTVIGHVVAEIGRSPVDHTIVAVREDAGKETMADRRPQTDDSGSRLAGIVDALVGLDVMVVTNPDPAGDMLSSVRCGLRALRADCQAVLVALGDQPAVTADLIGRMVDAYRTAGRGILVPVYRGRRGHPLLFSTGYRREVLTQHDGVGLRGLVQVHPEDVFELAATTSAVLSDMDDPDDYRRELARLAKQRGGRFRSAARRATGPAGRSGASEER